MKGKSNFGKVLAWGAAATAAGVAAKKAYDYSKKQMDLKNEENIRHMENGQAPGKAYFVGGGLGSMAGAAYLIRDCNMPGDQITIFEGMHILGGSNDGIGTPDKALYAGADVCLMKRRMKTSGNCSVPSRL